MKKIQNLITKIADVTFRQNGDKGDHVLSGGIFIGTDSDYEKKKEELIQLISSQGSIQKAKAAYSQKYPKDFITAAFKLGTRPKDMKAPSIFFSVGRSASKEQSEFYRDVQRGVMDPKYTQKLPRNPDVKS